MNTLQVQGAYGRDYTTARAAKAAWAEGKDFFELTEGRYVNLQDAEKYAKQFGVTSVEVYRRDGRLLTVIKVA